MPHLTHPDLGSTKEQAMRHQHRHTIIASLLAAIWIAVPLLAMIHIAAEEHNYCAEHGALEEGSGHHSSNASLASDAKEAPADALGSAPMRLPDNDAHTGCALTEQATHDIAPFEIAISVEAAPGLVTKRRSVVVAEAVASINILRGAPKTSPPLSS